MHWLFPNLILLEEKMFARNKAIFPVIVLVLITSCGKATPSVTTAATTVAPTHTVLIPTATAIPPTNTPVPPTLSPTSTETQPPTPTATEPPQPTPTVPSETVHFTTSDGVDLVGTLFGEGSGEGDIAVILTHMSAVGISRTSWFPFARHIARQGFTALAFDFRGWGASSGMITRMGEPKDILAAVELLQERGYERIVCMGASMGGIGCLKTAAEAPGTFEALGILAAPFPEGDFSSLTLPKVFVFTEQDYAGRDDGFDQTYQALPEPKEMVILPGQAHGTDIFNTPEADQLTDTLSGFLDSLR